MRQDGFSEDPRGEGPSLPRRGEGLSTPRRSEVPSIPRRSEVPLTPRRSEVPSIPRRGFIRNMLDIASSILGPSPRRGEASTGPADLALEQSDDKVEPGIR